MNNNQSHHAAATTIANEQQIPYEHLNRGILTIHLDSASDDDQKAKATAVKLAQQLGLQTHEDIPDKTCQPSEISHTVHILHMTAAKRDARIALVTSTPQGDAMRLTTIYFK